MGDESSSKQLQDKFRDPLWWLFMLPGWSIVVIAMSAVFGVINSSQEPFSTIENACFFLIFLASVLEGIRGTDAGTKKPLSTKARIGWIAFGVVGLGLFSVFLFFPGLLS